MNTYKKIDNILVEGAGIKVEKPVHVSPELWVGGVELAFLWAGHAVLVDQVTQNSAAKKNIVYH